MVLTFLIGLTGAVIGGLFTSIEAKRARKNQIADLRRESVDDEIRALHSEFVDLMSEVDQHPGTIGQLLGMDSWRDEWKRIWTPARRTSLRIGADVIPDKTTREALAEVLGLLNDAREYSSEAFWPAPTRRSLRGLVGLLAAEGVDIISAYRRDDAFNSKRTKLMKVLRKEEKEYAAWGKGQEERSVQAADAWYTALPEPERKRVDEDFERMISRRQTVPIVDDVDEPAVEARVVDVTAEPLTLRQWWDSRRKARKAKRKG